MTLTASGAMTRFGVASNPAGAYLQHWQAGA
jgi:hypothetical protein